MDWCTGWPDHWAGKYIGDCCEQHDRNLSTSQFFRCLRSKIGWFHAWYITVGGAIGAWIKYPLAMKKKI